MKTRLLKNHQAKLLAVVVATFFWFSVVTENEHEYNLEVPLRITSVPVDRILVGSLPATATVRFRGKGKALLALLFSGDARIQLDLSNLTKSTEVPLALSMIQTRHRRLPVSPIQILAPRAVHVELDDLVSKSVPITRAFQLSPTPGYTIVGSPHISPDSVIITGPKQNVRLIRSVVTEPEEFPDLHRDFQREIRLQMPADSLQILVSHETIMITAAVQKLIEITLNGVAIVVENAPHDMLVTPLPSTLSLTLEGGEQLLMGLKREDVRAAIAYRGKWRNGTDGYLPKITVPEGVRYHSIRPTEFKLMLESKVQ